MLGSELEFGGWELCSHCGSNGIYFKVKATTSCLSSPSKPCGVRNRNMSRRYVEVLNYQYSAKYASFTTNGKDYRNKVLNDKIEVSIVLDLEWIDSPSDF